MDCVNDDLRRAAEAIRGGGLAAFPTETVYGLGANALDARAVAEIFRVKGRPHTSPLIVHVASVAMARSLSRRWPAEADALADRFWPGPLTLVVLKESLIPDLVTAGLDSVGLRIPAHPLAIAFLREAGVPIAAPSANRFTELSPTTAAHVRASFGSEVANVLDGGACEVGIESTVLSLIHETPRLLRPGMVTQAEIEAVIGPVAAAGASSQGPHEAPGQHARHYRPRTPLYLAAIDELPRAGRGFYLSRAQMPADAASYAARLYAALHDLDRQGLDWIAIEPPPDSPEWAGVRDRLLRASTAASTSAALQST